MSLIRNTIIKNILSTRDPEKIGKLLGLLYREIARPTKAIDEFTEKIIEAFKKEVKK